MCIKKTLVIAAAALALQALTASAQTSVAGNTNLLRINFRATCMAQGTNGQLFASRLTESDIISQCVGTTQARNFVLVYNATADAIQVVDPTTGQDMCDVILFQGGDFTTGSRASRRLTFMFIPNQTNAIGSAFISERTTSSGTAGNRAVIDGTVQFVLVGTNQLGGAGTVASAAALASGTITNVSGMNISVTTASGTTASGTTVSGTAGTIGTTPFFFTTSALGGVSPNTNVRVCQATFSTTLTTNVLAGISATPTTNTNTINGVIVGTTGTTIGTTGTTVGTTGTTTGTAISTGDTGVNASTGGTGVSTGTAIGP